MMTIERMLPTPEALRTILDVTVHAGECEKVLRAYAEGRLIDGQAIADAYESSLYGENTGKKRLSDLLNAITKENTDLCLTHGHPQSTDPAYCWFGVHNEHHPCKFAEEES